MSDARAQRDVYVGDGARTRVPRVHVEDLRATFLGLDHPLEAHGVLPRPCSSPSITMQSEFCRSCGTWWRRRARTEVPDPGTVEECHIQGLVLDRGSRQAAVKHFLIR